MTSTLDLPKLITLSLLAILLRANFINSSSFAASCEYGVVQSNKLYSYSLASPIPDFPHGVLSEDGFYKVAANDTIIWFQLCDGMIFNHDPPRCVDCWDCGGPSRCGIGCSALVAKNTAGYYVCTSIGRDFNYDFKLMGDFAKASLRLCQDSSSSWGRMGWVWCTFNNIVICPRSLSTGWCSVSVFLPSDSRFRCYPKLRFLD